MSELRGVIVSHAAVAQALVAAVTAITGIEGVLTPVSNEGCGTEALGQRLREAVGAGPAVLFVDLPGGSCFTSSARSSLIAIARILNCSSLEPLYFSMIL